MALMSSTSKKSTANRYEKKGQDDAIELFEHDWGARHIHTDFDVIKVFKRARFDHDKDQVSETMKNAPRRLGPQVNSGLTYPLTSSLNGPLYRFAAIDPSAIWLSSNRSTTSAVSAAFSVTRPRAL